MAGLVRRHRNLQGLIVRQPDVLAGEADEPAGEEELLPSIAAFANGDARTALNTLEMAVLNGEISPDGSLTVTKETLEQCLGKKTLLYDKNGEEHYNLTRMLGSSPASSILASQYTAASGSELRMDLWRADIRL